MDHFPGRRYLKQSATRFITFIKYTLITKTAALQIEVKPLFFLFLFLHCPAVMRRNQKPHLLYSVKIPDPNTSSSKHCASFFVCSRESFSLRHSFTNPNIPKQTKPLSFSRNILICAVYEPYVSQPSPK